MQGLRRADAGDHIFTLSVGKILPKHLILAGSRVAREADTGSAIIAFVTKNHGTDVDRGAIGHVRRDVKLAPIVERSFTFPRPEYGFHCQLQLQHDVLRKFPAGFTLDDGDELFANFLEVRCFEAHIGLDASPLLDSLEMFVEVFVCNA